MGKGRFYKLLMGMMSRVMLSCEAAGILICKKQHDSLSVRENIALKMHLITCKLCQRFEEDINVVQSGIEHYNKCLSDCDPQHHLDEKQKKAIIQELENQEIKL